MGGDIDAFNMTFLTANSFDFNCYRSSAAPRLHEDLVATGFLGLAQILQSWLRLDVKAEEWADQVDTVMRTFQGLTVACARCHDHKYDPITVEDYHAVAGIFASTELVNLAYDKPEG